MRICAASACPCRIASPNGVKVRLLRSLTDDLAPDASSSLMMATLPDLQQAFFLNAALLTAQSSHTCMAVQPSRMCISQLFFSSKSGAGHAIVPNAGVLAAELTRTGKAYRRLFLHVLQCKCIMMPHACKASMSLLACIYCSSHMMCLTTLQPNAEVCHHGCHSPQPMRPWRGETPAP